MRRGERAALVLLRDQAAERDDGAETGRGSTFLSASPCGLGAPMTSSRASGTRGARLEGLDEDVDPLDRVQLAEVDDGRPVGALGPRRIGEVERRRHRGAGARVGALREVLLPLDLSRGRGTAPPRAPFVAPRARETRASRWPGRAPAWGAACRAPASTYGTPARPTAARARARSRTSRRPEQNDVESAACSRSQRRSPRGSGHVGRGEPLRDVREADDLRPLAARAGVPAGTRASRSSTSVVATVTSWPASSAPLTVATADGDGAAEGSRRREPGDTHEQPHSE